MLADLLADIALNAAKSAEATWDVWLDLVLDKFDFLVDYVVLAEVDVTSDFDLGDQFGDKVALWILSLSRLKEIAHVFRDLAQH